MPMKVLRHHEGMTTAVSIRGQTIIPKPLREAYHIREGDLVQWRPYQGGLFVQRVIVRPAQENELELSERDWRRLDRLVSAQRRQSQLTGYKDVKAAKEHSRKLAKYGR